MSDEITDPAIRLELRHIAKQLDGHGGRLDRHSMRIRALEHVVERIRGAWWAVSLAATGAAFVGSFAAQLFLKGR